MASGAEEKGSGGRGAMGADCGYHGIGGCCIGGGSGSCCCCCCWWGKTAASGKTVTTTTVPSASCIGWANGAVTEGDAKHTPDGVCTSMTSLAGGMGMPNGAAGGMGMLMGANAAPAVGVVPLT